MHNNSIVLESLEILGFAKLSYSFFRKDFANPIVAKLFVDCPNDSHPSKVFRVSSIFSENFFENQAYSNLNFHGSSLGEYVNSCTLKLEKLIKLYFMALLFESRVYPETRVGFLLNFNDEKIELSIWKRGFSWGWNKSSIPIEFYIDDDPYVSIINMKYTIDDLISLDKSFFERIISSALGIKQD